MNIENDSLTDGLTSEHIQQCIARARDYEFGRWFITTVGLVAESHPELLKEALSKVFDLKHMNRQADELAKRYKKALTLLGKLESDCQRVEDKIDGKIKELEESIDLIRFGYERSAHGE